MSRAFLLLAPLLAGLFAASLALGEQAIPITDILHVLVDSQEAGEVERMIVLDIRLPRALLAVLVGMALALAGAIVQTVMRNPLAEPGLIGINAGAALAALFLLVHLQNVTAALLPWAAFCGALGATVLIYALSWRSGASSLRIVLIGIGMSALLGAGANFLSAFGEVDAVQRAQVWLAGSLHNAGWDEVGMLAAWLVLPALVTVAAARELDVLRFDEMSSRGLGQRVELVRACLLLLCAIVSGAAVAASGLIGFVGLMAPHAARRMVGQRHWRLIPVAALVGAVLVLAADLIGRTVIAPAQLPAGIVTALLGAPFFAFLLWERRHVRT